MAASQTIKISVLCRVLVTGSPVSPRPTLSGNVHSIVSLHHHQMEAPRGLISEDLSMSGPLHDWGPRRSGNTRMEVVVTELLEAGRLLYSLEALYNSKEIWVGLALSPLHDWFSVVILCPNGPQRVRERFSQKFSQCTKPGSCCSIFLGPDWSTKQSFISKSISPSATLWESLGRAAHFSCGEWFENFPQQEMTKCTATLQVIQKNQQGGQHLPCCRTWTTVAESDQTKQTVSDFSLRHFYGICKQRYRFFFLGGTDDSCIAASRDFSCLLKMLLQQWVEIYLVFPLSTVLMLCFQSLFSVCVCSQSSCRRRCQGFLHTLGIH